jgi:hypothetical protein
VESEAISVPPSPAADIEMGMDRVLLTATIAFIGFMLLIHRVVAPYVVAHYGLLGTIGVCIACFGFAVALDRR